MRGDMTTQINKVTRAGYQLHGMPLGAEELKVLECFAQGLRAKQIAHDMRKSSRTVETQSWNIRGKLGASNTAHAVYLACKRGLI